MARVQISRSVQSQAGDSIGGASVQVNVRNGSAATVYSAETGSTTFSNPQVTDATGLIQGWVDEGSYDLVVTSGTTTVIQKLEALRGSDHLRVRQRSAPGGGAICFTWDDAYVSHDTIRQMANARNQHHTFCIVSDFVGTGGKLTSTQVLQMFQEGHEIANHSKTHAHMTGLTAAQRKVEYDTSQQAIDSIIGANNTSSFCIPYGERNATMDQELYGRFERGLATGTPTGLVPFIYPIGSTPFIIGRFSWDGTAQAQQQLLDMIRNAARMPLIYLTYAHDIGSANNPSLAQITAAMDLAQSLGVPCLTVSEALGSPRTLYDPGFEESPLVWNKSEDTPGARIAEVVTDTPVVGLSGSQSLHLLCNSDTGFVYVRQVVPVTPGVSYTLSGRYRVAITSGNGSIYMRIYERTFDGTPIASTQTAALTATSWTQASVARTITATGAFVYVDLVVDTKTAEAWFDHIHFGPTAQGVFG